MRSGQDTIVAISSAPGRSLRGLVRLAGPAAGEVLGSLLIAAPALPGRELVTVRLADPPIPALAALFPGPCSYTGDDVAELQLPGNPALLERVVRRTIAAGARLAEPGEFTFRAFLSGRLDLTQAEGVAATISATSDSQLRAAAQLRDGRLSQLAHALVNQLGTQLALVEAGIDFTDQEDVTPVTPAQLDVQLAEIESALTGLLEKARAWSQVEALPRVVLVGAPSSGKSTLFNALLGRSRAVVSAVGGTTRDVLEEPLALADEQGRPVEVMLVDLAGLDAAMVGGIDAEAQRQARQAIARADLVLAVEDISVPAGPTVLRIRTKADLGDSGDALHVSAATGLRMSGLREAIVRALAGQAVSLSGEALALQPRHEAALRQALEVLGPVRAALSAQQGRRQMHDMELLAAGLREALDALASLGGQLTPDDIIGRIFATFCIGK